MIGGENTGTSSVKNATRLFVLGADAIKATKPKRPATFTAAVSSPIEARRRAGQYMGILKGRQGEARHQHITQAGIVARGPYVSLPKRPRTDRTKCIAVEQVRNVLNGFAFSEKISRPLNVGLTAAWEKSPFYDGTPKSWSRCQTRFWDTANRWLKRRGVEACMIFVRERADGRGAHSHFMLHAPVWQRRPLFDYLNAKFKFQPDGLVIDDTKFGMQTPTMRAGHLKYLLKGIDHAAFVYRGFETVNVGAALGIDHRGQQGRVEIKRAGCSRDIDAAARKRAGWRELRDLAALHRVLNPSEGATERLAA